MNLILLHPEEIDSEGHALLTDHRASHVIQVLRKQPGEAVRIGRLNGPFGMGRVKSIHESRVELSCEFSGSTPLEPSVDLLLALPRPKVLKRLWAQLAALGVGHILLTNAKKVERYYFDSHVLDEAFYTDRLVEGLQQAGDTRLPRVSIHKQLKILVEDELDTVCHSADRVVLDPNADTFLSAAGDLEPGRLLLAIGPEGGWTSYELDLLQAHGFRPVSMGNRTLRTDTACIAALTLAHSLIQTRTAGVVTD